MAIATRALDARHASEDAFARATLRAAEVLLEPVGPRDFGVRLWTGDTLPPTAGRRLRRPWPPRGWRRAP